MREQRIFLEYGVDLALVRRQAGDVLPVKDNLSVIGIEKARDDAQQRGLAAAGRAEQCDKFIFIDVQRDAVEHALAVEFLDDIFDFDQFVHIPLLIRTESCPRIAAGC